MTTPDTRIAAAAESLLFASPEPLTAERIGAILEISTEEAQSALESLCDGAYENRGIHVVRVAGGYQMRTQPDFALFVGRLLAAPPTRISRAAMETLAIVAYRQPVTLPEIEAIRGVDAAGLASAVGVGSSGWYWASCWSNSARRRRVSRINCPCPGRATPRCASTIPVLLRWSRYSASTRR